MHGIGKPRELLIEIVVFRVCVVIVTFWLSSYEIGLPSIGDVFQLQNFQDFLES